eukprot:2145752-Pyramimonas_sp.AAC.1
MSAYCELRSRMRRRDGSFPSGPARPRGPRPTSEQQSQPLGVADLGVADQAVLPPAPPRTPGASSSSSAGAQ